MHSQEVSLMAMPEYRAASPVKAKLELLPNVGLWQNPFPSSSRTPVLCLIYYLAKS